MSDRVSDKVGASTVLEVWLLGCRTCWRCGACHALFETAAPLDNHLRKAAARGDGLGCPRTKQRPAPYSLDAEKELAKLDRPVLSTGKGKKLNSLTFLCLPHNFLPFCYGPED